MRTIGYRWPSNAPRGDFAVHCDYCGVKWRRSQCRRDASGLLACPDDRVGKDATTLDDLNSLGQQTRRRADQQAPGGFFTTIPAYTGDDDPLGLTQRTTAEDI